MIPEERHAQINAGRRRCAGDPDPATRPARARRRRTHPGAGTHKVAIARRGGSGAWTRLPVMNGATQAEYTDDIGHIQPSVARDGSGRFHVFASTHNNAWRYFHSDTVGGNPQNHSADLPDQGIGVTCPVLATAPNGDRYLLARLDGTQATAWHTTSVAPGLPISRLAVERDATGVDVLYLVDLSNNHLYHGRN